MSYKYRKGGTPDHQPNIKADATSVKKPAIGNSAKAQLDSAFKNYGRASEGYREGLDTKDPKYRNLKFDNSDADYAMAKRQQDEGMAQKKKNDYGKKVAGLIPSKYTSGSSDLDEPIIDADEAPRKKKK